MEILFPAGNLDYIKSAIECKANAVYGGLKNWNCRNKATNFSIQELKEAIEYCHKNYLKFYLTLNTLMFDDEIINVVNILKNNNIIPDAIICADLGLIKTLKREFPNIQLHASTQFGIANIDDANVAKELGFERVILSRELTKDEINEIRKNTQLEIEVFVWGSQCISFSGACYLGSLCNGGSANRGKCITLCRDRYLTNNKLGNFLYVPDLNCISEIVKTKGLDSLKLEGRRRPFNELQSAVFQIRGIETLSKSNGYILSENTSKNGLFEEVNSRTKLIFKENTLYENDVLIEKDYNTSLRFVDSINNNTYYSYTEIKKAFNPNLYNISLDLEQRNGFVTRAMLLVHKGEAYYFDSNEIIDTINVEDISISKDLNLNLYRITYKKEYSGQNVRISKDLIQRINEFLISFYSKEFYKDKNINTVAIRNICLETSDIEKAKILSKDYPTILNVRTVSILEKLNPHEFNSNVIFKLPFFNFKNANMQLLLKKLKNRKVMATKISQVYILNEIGVKDIFVDYLINVWNKETLKLLKSLNVKCFCSSPELSIEKNREIFKDDRVIHLLAGFPSCVFTRNCFKDCLNCKSCNNEVKDIKNSDRNIDFKIRCYDDHRVLIYKNPILNEYDKTLSNEMFRYIVNNESVEDIKKYIEIMQNDNYHNNLKKIKFWEGSFPNKLREDL